MAGKLKLDFEGGEELDFIPNPAFDGENGHALMQLQQDYADDPRFRLTPEFAKGDSPGKPIKKAKEDEQVRSERDVQMQILGEVVPAANRFKRDVRPLHIQRFDPSRPDQKLLIETPGKKRQREEPPVEEKPKKKDRRKKTKEKRKARLTESGEMRKKAPRKAVKPQVEVTAEVFKPTTERSEFRLFG